MEEHLKNIGIYLCAGCSIGKCLDMNRIQGIVEQDTNVVLCEQYSMLCEPAYVEKINNDIAVQDLNSILIAGCSSRVNNDVFRFPESVEVERANLREQVAWCHSPNDEDTQMLAEDVIRMSISKLKNIRIPEPYIPDNLNSEILVVGGGISGITVASEAIKAGYKVFLVEKEAELGGWISKWSSLFPESPPYDDISNAQRILGDIEFLNSSDDAIIYLSSEIKSISGQPGQFKVEISGTEGLQIKTVGAIVSATGWKPYDASKLGKYGYGIYPNVCTQIEFETYLKELGSSPSKETNQQDVLFIQCAGSRDKDHLPYCSNVCCNTTLKQAKMYREKNKNANVFILYKDIRTPGDQELFYQEIQGDGRIFLLKGDFESINGSNKKLKVVARNTTLGDDATFLVDQVVLATGMVPANTDELNLTYRLGKGLPDLKYGFPDSHFICFPYETRRTGIYTTGCQRAPQGISMCKEDASGAAMKAIQCIESLKRGEAVHPRSGDTTYPDLYLPRCTDCKRCTEECPFGSYDETEKGTPLPHPNRCRRCGICMGSCPERIINFDNFSIHSVSSMIKSVEIPDEFEEKPRILVFLCENDAYPAFDMAGLKKLNYSPYVRIIPVRCIGSINKVWLSDALSQGFDGIMQIGCKPGDDYQCHFITGSDLTEVRAENIQETLQTMMLEPERIQTEFLEINEYDKIPGMIEDYLKIIEEIGPNPFKDI